MSLLWWHVWCTVSAVRAQLTPRRSSTSTVAADNAPEGSAGEEPSTGLRHRSYPRPRRSATQLTRRMRRCTQLGRMLLLDWYFLVTSDAELRVCSPPATRSRPAKHPGPQSFPARSSSLATATILPSSGELILRYSKHWSQATRAPAPAAGFGAILERPRPALESNGPRRSAEGHVAVASKIGNKPNVGQASPPVFLRCDRSPPSLP
jgi:hypothetical protein